MTKAPFRADHVGSLLRPEALKAARERHLGPQTPQSHLGPHASEALRAVGISLQVRSYEEFEVGDVYEHRPGRTITETDNTWFTLLTMNNHPLHFDTEYAAQSEFRKPLVNSCLTLSIVVGMSVSDVSYKAIGNLGWNDIKLTAPVFAGDTLYAQSEVIAKRESQSRPTQGIVTVRTTEIGRAHV